MNPRDHNISTFRFHEFGYMGSYGHHSMLTYYDIPTISIMDVAISLLFSKKYAQDDEKHPFYHFHADKCCHPKGYVHTLTAFSIAYNIEEEMKWMNHRINIYQEDFSMKDPPEYRLPWRLTDKDVRDWVELKYESIDFSEKSCLSYLKSNRDWEFRSDSKDKFGLIATKESAHMSLELNFALDVTHLIVGFLSSYENVSPVHVWFSNLDDDVLCNFMEDSASNKSQP